MKLTEITKDKETFVRKLKDPAAQEMHELLDYMRTEFKDWIFNIRVGNNSASLYCEYKEFTYNPEDDRMMKATHGQMIDGAMYAVSTAEHWAWDMWNASAAGTTIRLLRR